MAKPKKNKQEGLEDKDFAGLEEFNDDLGEVGAQENDAAEEPKEEAEEPRHMSRKEYDKLKASGKAGKPKAAAVKPTDSLMRDKKGQVMKDDDGDNMLYAPGFIRQVGFVNENGVRFPVGYKFEGGHVGTRGNVVLNRCPKCGHQQTIDEALTGKCGNERVDGKRKACGFDMVHELEKIDLDRV